MLQAIATGQVQASGAAVTPKAVETAPFVARVILDDMDFAAHPVHAKMRYLAGRITRKLSVTESQNVAHLAGTS